MKISYELQKLIFNHNYIKINKSVINLNFFLLKQNLKF